MKSPRWVWWTMLAGAVVLLAWAWFLFGFLSEPSAVGRSRIVLTTWVWYSVASALAGVTASIGMVRGERWGRAVAGAAAAAMTLSCVGAIAGLPVLVGLVATRKVS